MTLDEMIEVLQAAKEGKTIEMRVEGRWVERMGNQRSSMDWDFPHMCYRVKPEPIERWMVVSETGDHYFDDPNFAEGFIQARPNQTFKLVRLVEATKDEA